LIKRDRSKLSSRGGSSSRSSTSHLWRRKIGVILYNFNIGVKIKIQIIFHFTCWVGALQDFFSCVFPNSWFCDFRFQDSSSMICFQLHDIWS
jgi:hypothetical protein